MSTYPQKELITKMFACCKGKIEKKSQILKNKTQITQHSVFQYFEKLLINLYLIDIIILIDKCDGFMFIQLKN